MPVPDDAFGLEVHSISKTYGATRALRDVSFNVHRGSLHALVGENGSGKSTLVKILAGVVKSDEGPGSIVVEGVDTPANGLTPDLARSRNLHFVHQDPGMFSDMTVADNLFLSSVFPTTRLGHISRRRQNRAAADVLERFNLTTMRPTDLLGGLSSGRRTMLAIARALKDQADLEHGVLVLDEPTAALPEREARLLLSHLRTFAEQGQTILYVTHRLDEVLNGADSFTAFRDGKHVTTATTRGLSKSELITHIIGRALTDISRDRAPIAGAAPRVLEVEELHTDRHYGISFSVRSGEVVGIAGILGSGRTSLLRTLFGGGGVLSGRVRVGGRPADIATPAAAMSSGFGYVPEDRGGDAVFPDMTVRFNLTAATLKDFFRGLSLRRSEEVSESVRIIDAFRIKTQSSEQAISSLSGGNQQKVIIGRWLRSAPKVLILDEPTQGVDVGARADIYELVGGAATKGMAILVASSDFEELELLCDRVLILRQGQLVKTLVGDQISVPRMTELAHASRPSSVVTPTTTEV
ncbi:MAG TPA: sugar ABC transporter ATP-binding protein [Pseudolysinimonas sp.]|nr:sugar ABC transporter ATP-binding protein [Pseudolysinimonas sp.]